MAFAAPNKDQAPAPPPPLKVQERNWTCADEELNGGTNCCDAVLKSRFVGVRTDSKNPNKFVPICEKCAKLLPLNKLPVPVDWRLIYGFGVVTWPVVVYGIPLLWRMLRG